MFYVTPMGEGSWMLAANFLQILPYMSFLFVDCALYLLTIRNHHYECNYTLSPVSPPSKSPNLGVVLGIPNKYSILILGFKESTIGTQPAFLDHFPSL